jgi:hypothetical protein
VTNTPAHTGCRPQERAADKAAELDELRARRYQEAKEREWRAKERAAAERAAALQAELARAREAQKASKIKQRAEVRVCSPVCVKVEEYE